jgi:hypothetical protein
MLSVEVVRLYWALGFGLLLLGLMKLGDRQKKKLRR